MVTAPITAGQMKELASAIIEAIPSDLPSKVAQTWIGRKRELGDKVRVVLLDQPIVRLPKINWQKVYGALSMFEEYAEFARTHSVKEEPSRWIVPVIKGTTCNKVVAAMRKLGVDFYRYADDLDKAVPTNDRDPNRDGSYVVSFLRTVEADEENKNLSANQLKGRNHKGITLLERLLLKLGYFLTTGQQLDVKNVTLCSGSRSRVGYVPLVSWHSDNRQVYVSWCGPDRADDVLRSRSAVSL